MNFYSYCVRSNIRPYFLNIGLIRPIRPIFRKCQTSELIQISLLSFWKAAVRIGIILLTFSLFICSLHIWEKASERSWWLMISSYRMSRVLLGWQGYWSILEEEIAHVNGSGASFRVGMMWQMTENDSGKLERYHIGHVTLNVNPWKLNFFLLVVGNLYIRAGS